VEPHKEWNTILKPSLRIPLQRPVPGGAIEAETVNIESIESFRIDDMSEYGPDWSAMHQITLLGDKDSEYFISLSNLREKKYHIDVFGTTGPEYGIFELFNNEVRKATIDGYSAEIVPAQKFRINDIDTENGEIQLRIKIPTKNELSTGYGAGLDAFVLIPDRNYIPEWYMIGPFPNKRESDYLRLGLDSVYAPELEIELGKTYIGAEDQEIRWQKVDGREGGYGMGLWRMYEPYEFVVCYAFTYIFSPGTRLLKK